MRWLLPWLREYPADAPLVIEPMRPAGSIVAGEDIPADDMRQTMRALCRIAQGNTMKKTIVSPPDKPQKNGRKGRSGRKPLFDRPMTAAERAERRLDKVNPNRKRYKKRAAENPSEEEDNYGT